MSYRYLVLVNDGQYGKSFAQEARPILNDLGMPERLTVGPIKLFASKETPVLPIPGGGVVIGHLFQRDNGSPVLESVRVPEVRPSTQICKHILDRYWGDYVLVQPGELDAHGFSVMRDPSGGLPCVYSIRDGTGFITSDIALATTAGLYTKRVDWDFVSSCLTYPHQRNGRTGLANINELLPGCCLSTSNARITMAQLWSPWDFVAAENRCADPLEAKSDVHASINLAVKAWAQTDQSVLLELSGGLDSSILAACLRETGARVECSTVTTPLPGADERQYARLMAEQLGVALHSEELRFEDARFDFEPPSYLVTPGLMVLQYATNSVFETLGERLGIASYFSGAGGDAIFCYLKTAAPAADAIKERGLALGSTVVQDLAQLHQCTLWKASRLTLKKLVRAPKAPRKADHSFIAPSKIFCDPSAHPWFDAPADALPGDRERIFDLACTHAFRDSSPRGTKRWMRMPLLSQPVMEACLRVPTWMWFAGGRNRAVARSAFANLLPREILDRASKGTFMNYSAAVYRRNIESVRDFLLTGCLQSHGFLDSDALKRFFQTELRPRDQKFMRIFDLAMIENWVRHQPAPL